MNKIIIIGYGDIGQRVSQHWSHAGLPIHILSRQPQKTPGVITHCVDLDQNTDRPLLPTGNALIYYFVPCASDGENDARVTRFIRTLNTASPPKRIIYISTSGVYGDCQGDWVTEDRLPQPQTPRSQRRLAAENAFLHWGKKYAVDITLLRVSGIYGPDRLPLKRIQQQQAILRRDLAPYSNRIHADDLAQICVAASQGPAGIYNVADGNPSTMSDYFIAVAQAHGLPQPPEINWAEAQEQFTPAMLSYLTESRRLDITKIKTELGVELRYPSLEAGLNAC